MKTEITKSIEKALFNYCYESGQFAVDEVTMPAGYGIVDTLSVQFKGTSRKGYSKVWRFFEIKVTKADFFSKAVKSFYGHYNYFVFPASLYNEVKTYVPCDIGVLVADSSFNLTLEKKPKKKTLLIQEDFLDRALINSMAREVKKAKQIEKGLRIYKTETLATEMLARHPYNSESPLADMYEKLFLTNRGKFIQLLTESATTDNQKEMILGILDKRYQYFKQEVEYLTQEVDLLRKEKRKLRHELRCMKLSSE